MLWFNLYFKSHRPSLPHDVISSFIHLVVRYVSERFGFTPVCCPFGTYRAVADVLSQDISIVDSSPPAQFSGKSMN